MSIHKGWVTRIASRLEELGASANRPIIVVNKSVSGNTTRQALERMPYDVQTQPGDIMIVQFGMNDCNHWLTDKGVPRVSRPAFRANVQEIINRGRVHGIKSIILNTNHTTLRRVEPMIGTSLTYEANNRLYNETIRSIAEANVADTILNDMEQFFEDATGGDEKRLSKYLLDDGLHLSVQGHDLYYYHVSNVLDKIVCSALNNNLK